MKKLNLIILGLFAIFTLSACGEDEGPEPGEVAADYMGEAAVRVASDLEPELDDIEFTLAEYESVFFRLETEFEDSVDERVAYFIHYQADDLVGYAVVMFSFTYDPEELDPEPDPDAWEIDIYTNVEEFETATDEAIDTLNTFEEQSQNLVDALEAEDEDISYELLRITGDFDTSQIEDFIELYLDPDNGDAE